MMRLNLEIEYSFMTVGHTKFSCDRCFGVFKKKCNQTELWTLYDIAKTCNKSGVCHYAELVGTHDGNVLVECFDWANMFAPHFRKISNITDYHHFRCNHNEPGIVYCLRELDDEPVRLDLRKKNAPASFPELTECVPSGFSEERSKYLFDEIREFCKQGTEDLVAPRPTEKRHKGPQ